ncbi:MAG: DUF4136 domain-containing protein [Candidatus Cyclobacteriaceae bacterium M3_2C_046]
MRIKGAFLIILTVFLFGCAPTPKGVVIDYDQDAVFSEYKTFYWSDEILQDKVEQPMFYNSLVKKRIKEAVASEMQGRGYEITEQDPDLLINAHMVIEEKTEYQSSPTYSYRYWGPDNIRVSNYKEGTLVIDLIDRDQKQLVWQGYYTGTFLDAKEPEDKSRAIRDAVSLIFQKYQHRAN